MSKNNQIKLTTQSLGPSQKQRSFVTIEEPSLEQNEESIMTELDQDIECPRCNDIMELNSKFDALVYYCENCSFFLKCV
jgi:Zn finger protein HypA/HybF involved in hydrogenase expression